MIIGIIVNITEGEKMKTNIFKPAAALAICLLITLPASAQKKHITYGQAYKWAEPKIMESLPNLRWYGKDKFLKKSFEKSSTQYILVDAVTGKENIFFDTKTCAEELNLPEYLSLNRAHWNKDFSAAIILHKGNIFYINRKNRTLRQLTAFKAPVKNPTFSPDFKYIAFTRSHNLYVVNMETGLEKQLTNDGSDTIYNGWASWVYYEEVLGRGSRYRAFYWSPDSKKIAFLRFDDSKVPEFTLFRADGVHGELEVAHYPKPGDPNPDVTLGIVSVKTGDIVWVDTKIEDDQYIAWTFWTPDSKQLLFQWMNRDQDSVTIYSADPVTGKRKEVYTEHQDSWVEFFQDIYIFKDSKHFILRSDKNGWPHLYLYTIDGKLIKQLTKGNWPVKSISFVDEKNNVVYFTGFKSNSTENHLFRINLNGKRLKQLTKTKGNHYTSVSPSGKYFIDRYSNIDTPSKMDLYKTDGTFVKSLGDSRTAKMDEYAMGKTELFTIPSGDGYNLPAVWTLPPDFDPNKKYPVIISVYGGPGSASVRNSFPRLSSYFLADKGIIVFSVDHRGSGHFGKKGMALMYRNLGKWEMHDYIAAVKWLRQKDFVDSTRIGITGGSYGGYVTCMAMTYGADYFNFGNALYSVTDWKLYDSIYTERYMDTPKQNPEGYKNSSVLTYADKYKGGLRIVHGTMDDNVHMQNTIRLIDKLEDMDKDFELMIYPNARHGIGFPKRSHSARESVQFWMRHFFGKDKIE